MIQINGYSKILAFLFLLFAAPTKAQDKLDIKFGKVSRTDFNLTADKFDSGANALIIADIGSTSFEGDNNGSFTLVFTRFLRVKIINKNGLDAGNRKIFLYRGANQNIEKLTFLKGVTFNLENGNILETKLDEKSVFIELYDKSTELRKISMPGLKEGSIFDLQYTIKSPFESELRPWSFQGEYPRLWSEYEVTIAPPYHYVMRMQGDEKFDVNTTKEINSNFSIRKSNGVEKDELYSIAGNSLNKRWVKKNVPSIREEPFTTTIDNYNSQASFQLNYFQWNAESERHNYMTTWNTRSKVLLEEEEFWRDLTRENNWMSDELKMILREPGSDEDKARKIYGYIRDNFKCNSTEGLYAHSSLKEVFRKKEGNVTEINLLLTAMLRKAGIDADPLILSTRDNGIAEASYPLISQYNYVICVAIIGSSVFTLDASRPFNGFGQLPVDCYNGWGHIISEEKPLPVPFIADSAHETSLTMVIMVNDDKGKISGSYKSVLGKSASYDLRSEIRKTSEKDYEKKLQNLNGSDLILENLGIDSLKKYDFPVTVHYDFEYKNPPGADVLYFNPLLEDGYKTNPFKSMERHYPVEMPYQIDETYLLNMDIPAGYLLDELPKSVRVAYNENEGQFEYLVQKGEGSLQVRVRLKLNKAFFPTDEYNTLRDFFAFVVKKETEQIVFKKIP